MSDFLDYVERNYGCVTEYNRCREEEAEYEYEREEKRRAYYQKNKDMLKKAESDGTLVYFSEDCYDCPSYTDIGMTDEYDDVPHGICGNLKCTTCTYRSKKVGR